MRRTRGNRILSVLMSIVMLIMLLPMPVFAENGVSDKNVMTEEHTETETMTEKATESELQSETGLLPDHQPETAQTEAPPTETAQTESADNNESITEKTTDETLAETEGESEETEAVETEKQKEKSLRKAARSSSADVIDLTDNDAALGAAASSSSKYSFNSSSQEITITGPVTVMGTTNSRKIIVAGNTEVKIENVSIDLSSNLRQCALTVNSGNVLTLSLQGTNRLVSGEGAAGINVSRGAEIHITASDSTHSLEARGGGAGSGIGGQEHNAKRAGGNIYIENGTVTVQGGTQSAGIGGGQYAGPGERSDGGLCKISGGVVIATGGSSGAGIGGGLGGNGGVIEISGGMVTANSGSGGAGIGGGGGAVQINLASGSGGTIRISGGKVIAGGGASGAGIGGGGGSSNVTGNGNTGNIVISGGMVNATGFTHIGHGRNGTVGGSIVITGGSVNVGNISPQPLNGIGRPVYLNTLQVGNIRSEEAITGGSIDDVPLSASSSAGYGIRDVTTDGGGSLYFWLPQIDTASVVSVISGGVNYRKTYPRNDQPQTQTLLPLAPDVIFPTAANITYGEAVSEAILSGGTTGRGSFVWAEGVGTTRPPVGAGTYVMVFTPNDLDNYDYSAMDGWDSGTQTVRGNVSVTVDKARAPDVTFPTASPLTYEETLGNSTLSNGAEGRGSFAWEEGTIIPTVENDGYTVVFTPSDTANYDYTEFDGWDGNSGTVRRKVSIDVIPFKVLKVDFPAADDLTYEDLLSDSGLNGGSVERGTFAWEDGTTVPIVRNSGYPVVFTPSDTDNYDYSSIGDWDNENKKIVREVSIKVIPFTVSEVEFPTANDLTYEDLLSDSELNGGSVERGTFAWEDGTTVPIVQNSGYPVVFTPSDTDNYDYGSIGDWDNDNKKIVRKVSISVIPFTVPEVEFPAAEEVTYEERLSDSALHGGSIRLGTFAWEDATTVPLVQNSGYPVVFTPSDTDNYDYSNVENWDNENKKIVREVSIKVIPFTVLEVEFPTADDLTYEDLLSDSELNGGSVERGSFVWEDGTTVPIVRNSGYPVVFTPSDTDNYDYSSIGEWDNENKKIVRKVSIKVNPYTVSKVEFPTANDLIYETPLSDSGLNGGSIERGTFAWEDGTALPTVQNNGYPVIFTPNDAVNYDYSSLAGWDAGTGTIRRTVDIAVANAVVPEVEFPEAAAITYGMSLADATLANTLMRSSVTAKGTFTWEDVTLIPPVKNSGYTAVFTPADLDNYDYSQVPGWDNKTQTVRRTLSVTVNPVVVAETDVVFPKAGEVHEGDTLEFAELTDGSTELGSFAWENDKIVPTVKNEGYTVVFTPNDTDNYDYSKVPGWDAETRTVRRIVPVKVIKETPAAESYRITVQKTGNGTAKASVSRARAGKKITLTATAASGYRFKQWQVVSGDITIKEGKFTMPEEDVTVRAVFERTTGTNTTRYTRNTTTRNTTTRSPRTGDNNQVLPYVLLALAALGCIGAAGYRRKTKR